MKPNWKQFYFEDLCLIYPSENNRQYLQETFIFDIYNGDLINKGDIVLDLGAAAGDFCFLASRRTGKRGKVIAIEPNQNDFEIIKKNIEYNKIQNIIPLNIGVGKDGVETITYRSNTYSFKSDTLLNILNHLAINSADFIKMDIEGYEVDVIKNSPEVFNNARVVAVEFHDTKEQVDSMLLNMGFKFYPINTVYLIKKLLGNLIPYPILSLGTLATVIKYNPRLIYKIFTGYDKTKESMGIFNGLYIKD